MDRDSKATLDDYEIRAYNKRVVRENESEIMIEEEKVRRVNRGVSVKLVACWALDFPASYYTEEHNRQCWL